jgi:uncharacterized protein YdhG (YjbR/CyaY superfamily)
MKPLASVDEYIAAAPREARAKLRELRSAIKAAAPGAEECISYGIPYYKYQGRLAYFGLWKSHIGLYALVPPVAERPAQLARYLVSKGTIRIPLNEKLPIALIKKLVKLRLKKNKTAKKRK